MRAFHFHHLRHVTGLYRQLCRCINHGEYRTCRSTCNVDTHLYSTLFGGQSSCHLLFFYSSLYVYVTKNRAQNKSFKKNIVFDKEPLLDVHWTDEQIILHLSIFLEATFPYSENLHIPCFHRTPDLGLVCYFDKL